MNTSIYNRQWDVGSFTDPTKKPYKVSERRDGRLGVFLPGLDPPHATHGLQAHRQGAESQLLLTAKPCVRRRSAR